MVFFYDNLRDQASHEFGVSYTVYNLHNNYPLAPKKVKVTTNMPSNNSYEVRNKYNISTAQVYNLLPTLNKKDINIHKVIT